MPDSSYLKDFIKECASVKPEPAGERAIGWEDTVFILVGYGLKLLLPELKEWLKLGASVITMKRLEIKRRLLDYAKQRELDFQEAARAADVIVEKIDEKNIGQLVAALEKENPSR
jgi:hypothetical protein